MSQHLFFGLQSKGFEVVCMEARQVSAALSAMRNKTDKTDAKGIAQILRTGWFSPVHMKSREAHGLRALLSTRKALLKKTMDLANEVRGLLKIFGVRLPRTVKHGSFDGLVRPIIEMDDVLAHPRPQLITALAKLSIFAIDDYFGFIGDPELQQAVQEHLNDLEARLSALDQGHESYLAPKEWPSV